MTWPTDEAVEQVMLVLAVATRPEPGEDLAEALGPFIDRGPAAMFGLVCSSIEAANRLAPRPLRPGDGKFLALEVDPKATTGDRAAGQIITAFLNGDTDTAAHLFMVLATDEARASDLVDVLLYTVGMAASFIRQKMDASG